jgi:hypothetical protein
MAISMVVPLYVGYRFGCEIGGAIGLGPSGLL